MATRKRTAPGRSKPPSGRKDSVPALQKRVGRPPAKHSSPDYVQMSVYVHKDVRADVKVRLFQTGGEFSGLVLRHGVDTIPSSPQIEAHEDDHVRKDCLLLAIPGGLCHGKLTTFDRETREREPGASSRPNAGPSSGQLGCGKIALAASRSKNGQSRGTVLWVAAIRWVSDG